MRLYIGGRETLVPARWFWADPEARWFPSPHGCEASPWLKDNEVNLEWGEVCGPKTLDRGINPGYPGQCYVGERQWFEDGHVPQSLRDWIPTTVTPCCGYVPPPNSDWRCPQPPRQLNLALGGESIVTPFLRCGACKHGQTPSQWNCTISGATLFWPFLNGQYVISQVSGCSWIYHYPGQAAYFQVNLNNVAGSLPTLDVFDGSTAIVNYNIADSDGSSSPPYDCSGVITLTLPAGSIAPYAPTSIILSPVPPSGRSISPAVRVGSTYGPRILESPTRPLLQLGVPSVTRIATPETPLPSAAATAKFTDLKMRKSL